MANKTLSGAEVIIECLKREGIDTIFGYPSGSGRYARHRESASCATGDHRLAPGRRSRRPIRPRWSPCCRAGT